MTSTVSLRAAIYTTIDPYGRITFDLGPSPDPQLVAPARELAVSMGASYVAEAGCLSAEEKQDIAQRLVRLLLGGAS